MLRNSSLFQENEYFQLIFNEKGTFSSPKQNVDWEKNPPFKKSSKLPLIQDHFLSCDKTLLKFHPVQYTDADCQQNLREYL